MTVLNQTADINFNLIAWVILFGYTSWIYFPRSVELESIVSNESANLSSKFKPKIIIVLKAEMTYSASLDRVNSSKFS